MKYLRDLQKKERFSDLQFFQIWMKKKYITLIKSWPAQIPLSDKHLQTKEMQRVDETVLLMLKTLNLSSSSSVIQHGQSDSDLSKQHIIK